MLGWIALGCLVGALAVLALLSLIDLRTRLLPNRLVLAFAALGAIFHFATMAHYLSIMEMLFGAAIGFGSLYVIRMAANYMYKADALGLGDVKLMGAAGLWLGPDMITVALMIGALAGLAHGAGVALWQAARTGAAPSLARLQIPAGPGFAAGIVAAGGWLFRDFFTSFGSVLP